MTHTAFRTCPLCEATCGIAVDLDDSLGVVRVRGDREDPLSHGFICPKGVSLGELHSDPDRLRFPLVRSDDGVHRRTTWDDAFAIITDRLAAIRAEHGNDAVAVYLGNPNVHNVSATLYGPALVKALGTRMIFSASTVDQMPQQVAVGLMYGTGLSVAVPDIDRTDYLLVLGANPMVSNGSMWTVPDVPGRLRALHARGGRLVVVDPVRTRTAEVADEHLRIRPGTDGFLVAGLVNIIIEHGLEDLGAAAQHVDDADLAAIRAAAAPFTADRVAALTGIDAAVIERLAREVAGAACAAVYGRMGTTTAGIGLDDGSVQSFATAASWWIAIANLLTGNLDRPGGVMWPLPAVGGPTTAGTPGTGRGLRVGGPNRTRVRGLPSVLGEFPAAALAEEIDTPGDGRVRALITIAGNPVVSTPDGGRLADALASLDLMVSVDAYLTETSRNAHVILPAPSPLARPHIDIAFASLACRNTVRWAPPAVDLRHDDEADERDEGDTLLALASAALGGAVDVDTLDDLVATEVATRATSAPASIVHGRDPAELVAATSPRRRIERLVDILIRTGPYGDGFGARKGLTLDDLEATDHGIDLGPLQPRLPDVLRTPSGRIDAAPPLILEEASRMAAVLVSAPSRPDLLLVGRRGLRTNNSWMRNIPLLSGGSNRCTLWVHPDDARAHGVADGATATVSSVTGAVRVAVEVTDAVMPGVVCLPHGWGQEVDGVWGSVAALSPGANVNVLTPTAGLDGPSGNAVLSGIPVRLVAA